jgi:hypothetical protein
MRRYGDVPRRADLQHDGFLLDQTHVFRQDNMPGHCDLRSDDVVRGPADLRRLHDLRADHLRGAL